MHLIRYADILLMYAECLIHEGSYDQAITYINQVRSRAANDFVAADATTKGAYTLDDKVNGKSVAGAAGNYRIGLYPTSGNTEATATAALRAERRAEFGMEGHRWYDLCRWGIASTELNDYVAYENTFFGSKFNTYGGYVMLPIPFTEITYAQGRIVQNADWK